MMVSTQFRFGFLHIRKTGGTSFSTLVSRLIKDEQTVRLWNHHESLEEARKALPKRGIDPDSLTYTTIIRNPFAQLVSLYFFFKRQGINRARLTVQKAACNYPFPDFVDYYTKSKNPRDRTYFELLQINGEVPLDLRIMHTETLQADTDSFLDYFNLPGSPKLRKLNTTDHPPVQDMCKRGSVLVDRVLQRYRWCFEAGHYSADPQEQKCLK